MTKTPSKRIHRFFAEQVKEHRQVLDLPDDLLHYTSRVLRLLNGTEVELWDGNGHVFPAKVNYLSKRLAQFEVTGHALTQVQTELTRALYIAQGLPESDKMDGVLSKCTEMGAAGFLPIQAERSVVKLNATRADKRQQHWAKVLVSASLQSERMRLPSLGPAQDLASTLAALAQWQPLPRVLLLTPNATDSFSQWLNAERDLPSAETDCPLVILVGPEGGWSEAEQNLAVAQGARLLQFSPRILRTETFGLACLSQLVLGLSLEP